MARLTFLGTGTSSGIPVIGCSCPVCMSSDPRDKRLRTGAHITLDNGAELHIDAGTDFRAQCLQHGITRIDHLLFTHAHADHSAGIHDLREINWAMQQPIPLYGNASTLRELQSKQPYLFNPSPAYQNQANAHLRPNERVPWQTWEVDGTPITCIPIQHGKLEILAYRMANIAFVTDASYISAEAMAALQGLDVLVMNALRYRAHPSHFSMQESLDCIHALRPKRAYLHHFAHDADTEFLMTHEGMLQYLRRASTSDIVITPAYDGLEIVF